MLQGSKQPNRCVWNCITANLLRFPWDQHSTASSQYHRLSFTKSLLYQSKKTFVTWTIYGPCIVVGRFLPNKVASPTFVCWWDSSSEPERKMLKKKKKPLKSEFGSGWELRWLQSDVRPAVCFCVAASEGFNWQQEHTHTCTETYRQHDIVLPLLPWKLTGLSLKNSPIQVCVCVRARWWILLWGCDDVDFAF